MIEKALLTPSKRRRRPPSPSCGLGCRLISVASRLIGGDLNDAEHRKIIERYVNEAGSFSTN